MLSLCTVPAQIMKNKCLLWGEKTAWSSCYAANSVSLAQVPALITLNPVLKLAFSKHHKSHTVDLKSFLKLTKYSENHSNPPFLRNEILKWTHLLCFILKHEELVKCTFSLSTKMLHHHTWTKLPTMHVNPSSQMESRMSCLCSASLSTLSQSTTEFWERWMYVGRLGRQLDFELHWP